MAAPDYQPRVSGPGKFSQRTDMGMQKGQPLRIPTGQAYGKAKQLEQLEQSSKMPNVQAAQPQAPKGEAPSLPPAASPDAQGAEADPRQVLAMIANKPSQNPQVPLVPQGMNPANVATTRDMADALEDLISRSKVVSPALLRLTQELRRASSVPAPAGPLPAHPIYGWELARYLGD